jgi:CCR4-NOT transcription complex subunit 3
MKKVDEGVELFDDTWEKVYSAEQQNQKEKYEMDLKKEIKKLQRLRDQIKTWIGSSDVKDKDHLIEARKLIETKMEQFKVCEKETKTKTYSKEGLARESRMDPEEQAKHEVNIWIGDLVERLQQLVEDRDVEIERLCTGKGRKTNKNIIEQFQGYVLNHKYHISKLEGIMRLVNNDRLDTDSVNALREDLDYYVDSYEDEEYQQQYDEEFFYESLGLDELDLVNVDRVTQAVPPPKIDEEDDDQSTKDGKKEKKVKAKGSTGIIPLTIGRAKVATAADIKVVEKAPSKISQPMGSSGSNASSNSGPSLGPAPVPTPRPPPSVVSGGASMAAILKRESEQQEKKRQEEALQQQQVRIACVDLKVDSFVVELTYYMSVD